MTGEKGPGLGLFSPVAFLLSSISREVITITFTPAHKEPAHKNIYIKYYILII